MCVQLCLSGLSDRSRLQANAAMLGVSLLLQDVLNSGREAGPVRLHGNEDDLLPDEEAEEETRKTGLSALLPPQDPVRVQSVLKGFLLLTKQLQVFKEIWTRRRLGARAFETPGSCQQSVELYRAEIFDPSMRALARRMGKERDYEASLCGGRPLLPPPGASEVDVKAEQLHHLLESTECDMIRAVQTRVNGEMALAVSERSRRDEGLPTELWKKGPLKYTLTPERPHIVETFVQQLMEGAEEAEGQLRVSARGLQRCVAQLGCSLAESERRSFLLRSQFYEQILQHETGLLYRSEQDLKNLQASATSGSHKEVTAGIPEVACRGMMMEISALQTRVAHLEEEKRTLEEQLGLRFRERYDPLVRHLFATCIQLKAQLDQYRRRMQQDVSEMVTRVRVEGVDRIMKLRKKLGSTDDGDALVQLKKEEEVHEFRRENRRLSALLCQQKALSRWRQAVDHEKIHRQLLETQQREIACRSDALGVKMRSEEEVMILQEQLEAARKALSCSRAECSGTETLLGRKAEQLQLARHQSAQEARGRRELDGYRAQSLERMKAAVEDGERRLRGLSGQLDRGSRMNRLHRQRSAREMKQVRSQLQQELSLKREAFQQVNRLQDQVTDLGAAATAGPSRSDYNPSVSRWRTTGPSAGLHRAGRQHSGLRSSAVLQDSAAEPARSRSHARMDRAKAEPSRLRDPTAPDRTASS